jgi:multicomponent Na+:H+ antiporter subunit F
MPDLYFFLAFILILSTAAGLMRILSGPAPADRMLAVQLAGTSGVAVVLLLSEGAGLDALTDVALVYALLAAVTLIAFVKVRGGFPAPPGGGRDD